MSNYLLPVASCSYHTPALIIHRLIAIENNHVHHHQYVIRRAGIEGSEIGAASEANIRRLSSAHGIGKCMAVQSAS